MNADRQFLRAGDIASMLGVTTGRVYQLIAAGEIPVVKVGGAIRIPRSAWAQWLEGQTEAALGSLRVSDRAAAQGRKR
jgi:excisionase family DNA binding protein